MPRPNGPKPIRSGHQSQRVAKSSRLAKEVEDSRTNPLGPRGDSLKNSDSASVTVDRRQKLYPGKENTIPSAHLETGTTKPLLAVGKISSLRGNETAPIRSSRAAKLSSSKESRSLEAVKRASLAKKSPVLASTSPSASSSERGRRQQRSSVLAGASSRANSQAYRPQGTPLGHSSVLGVLKFKKRARQPSLLQVAQSQQDDTSQLDDTDFLDFRPDDESTPLVKSSFEAQKRALSSSSNSQRSRKRKLGDSGIDVLSPKSQEQSLSLESDQASALNDSSDLAPDAEEEEILAPELPRLSARRTQSPVVISDSQAPPRSSSYTTESPSRPSRQNARQGASNEDRPLSLPSSPSTTVQRTRKKAAELPLPPSNSVTTARLQHLLPRRRTRLKKQNTFDIPSSSDVELDASGLAEDEDELSFHATTKMRRMKPKGEKTPIQSARRRTNKGKHDGEDREPKRQRASTTYAREAAVDNDGGDDDDGTLDTADTSVEVDEETGKVMPVLDTKAKAEMKRLAEKFKEIDDFDMEFEDVTGSSSQMHDAR